MKKLWIFLVLATVAVVGTLWHFSAERVVKRQAVHLMNVVSMSENAAGLMRQGKVYSMNAMLAPEVELVIPEVSEANGVFGKQEMESAFSSICQHAKSSDFRVLEFSKVEVKGEDARTDMRVEGYMEMKGGMRPVDGVFEVVIEWKKGGDGWRFTKISWQP